MSRKTLAARRIAALALAAPLAFQTAAIAAAKKPYGGETPQAVVERMNAAGQSKDFSEIAACLAPDDRNELALGLMLGAGMMIGFMQMGGDMMEGMAEGMAEGMTGQELTAEQKKDIEKGKKEAAAKAAGLQKRYDEILGKHKLAEKMEGGPAPGGAEGGAAIRELFKEVDTVALVSDLGALMTELGESADEGKISEQFEKQAVTDYKIEGDRATAKSGSETVEFVKVDGRWYVKAPEKKEGAGE